jgi:hypothetical protein
MVLPEARTPPELACRAPVRASSAAVTVRIAVAVTFTVVRATVTLPMPIAVVGVALTMIAAPMHSAVFATVASVVVSECSRRHCAEYQDSNLLHCSTVSSSRLICIDYLSACPPCLHRLPSLTNALGSTDLTRLPDA